MTYPNHGVPVWFGFGRRDDARRLHSWRQAPVTYSPDQELDSDWNVDRYEIVLGEDPSGSLFRRAALLTLHNQFYPREVMEIVSDYSLEARAVRQGDRVLQRIQIFQLEGLPIFQILTMNEITDVTDEPRRAGFTYITTAAHSEVGEWSPSVTWRENNEVVLTIEVASRTRPGATDFARQFSRKLQLHAHKLSIQNFKALLLNQSIPAPAPRPMPKVVPVTMLLVAGIMLVNKLWSFAQHVE